MFMSILGINYTGFPDMTIEFTKSPLYFFDCQKGELKPLITLYEHIKRGKGCFLSYKTPFKVLYSLMEIN